MASVARFVLAAGVLVGGVTLFGPSDAQGQPSKPPPDPPSTAHGVNFLIKSQADQTFCIQVTAGNTEGRTITMAQCGTVDNQKWMLTNNNDESNLLIDNVGMCLDGRNRKGGDGLALPVQKCRFGEAWRFAYLATGQIRDDKNNKCLSITGAASGAPVSLAECDATKTTQKWALAH